MTFRSTPQFLGCTAVLVRNTITPTLPAFDLTGAKTRNEHMRQPVGIALLALLATLATGQQTVGEAADAKLQQNYEALKQHEMGVMNGCYTLYEAASQVDDRQRRLMLGENGFLAYNGQAAVFWKDYLGWLGAEVSASKAAGLVQAAKARAQHGPKDGVFVRTQQIENSCRDTKTALNASACEQPAEDKTFYVPIRMLSLAKVCRELAARSSRSKPAQWLREKPDQLAQFNKKRARDKAQVQHYDAVLAGQPVPQCPTGFLSDGSVALFGGGGSNAFQPEADMVKAEYEKWANHSERDNYSTENTLALSQMPYIKWQGECDKFEKLAGFPPELQQ